MNENGESVYAVARKLALGETGLHHYADYCAACEMGLRRDGLDAIERLIRASEDATDVERRATVALLCRILEELAFEHRLIPYPLRVRLLEPVLVAQREGGDPDTLRWLGQLTGDIELPRSA